MGFSERGHGRARIEGLGELLIFSLRLRFARVAGIGCGLPRLLAGLQLKRLGGEEQGAYDVRAVDRVVIGQQLARLRIDCPGKHFDHLLGLCWCIRAPAPGLERACPMRRRWRPAHTEHPSSAAPLGARCNVLGLVDGFLLQSV